MTKLIDCLKAAFVVSTKDEESINGTAYLKVKLYKDGKSVPVPGDRLLEEIRQCEKKVKKAKTPVK